jgi:hypothetical protein
MDRAKAIKTVTRQFATISVQYQEGKTKLESAHNEYNAILAILFKMEAARLTSAGVKFTPTSVTITQMVNRLTELKCTK